MAKKANWHLSRLSRKIQLGLLALFIAVIIPVGLFALKNYEKEPAEAEITATNDKTESDTEATKETKLATSESTEVATDTDNTVSPNSSSTPTKTTQPKPNPQPAPAPQTSTPFAVTSVYLDQPAVYCSGGGEYYIAQIGDVILGLSTPSGGQITYGYEVTGGIPDYWNGYHQPGTIPAGVMSTSINKIYWGNSSDPQMAWSRTVEQGHGPAAVRAVIYTPNTIYSPWVQIPAQGFGELCTPA